MPTLSSTTRIASLPLTLRRSSAERRTCACCSSASLAQRSLQTQRQGIEIAGHNLANVNNPAYSRQRLKIETSISIPSPAGPQGTGADAVSITQLRDNLLDRQVTSEAGITGFLELQQRALEYAQAGLGQQIDRQASGAEGSAAASGVAGQHGIAESMSDLFNAFQSASASPTSLAERQILLMKAGNLANKFVQVDGRLANLAGSLNDGIRNEVVKANELMSQIAKIDGDILNTETSYLGVANDLRDTRQQKLEELSKLVKFDASTDANGTLIIDVNGQTLVSGSQILDTLQAYDAGSGRILTRTTTGSTPLNLTGGSIQGAIDVRDGAVNSLRSSLNTLAATLIADVNAVHQGGYSMTGSTGQALFTGTGAASMGVNSALTTAPGKVQLSGVSGAVGDNTVALRLAGLADTPSASLGGQTYQQSYNQLVSSMGQSLASVNDRLSDQSVVEGMLKRQRDAVSGVSLDEEMTDLMKFQRAYEASAKLVTVVDQMLEILMQMKR